MKLIVFKTRPEYWRNGGSWYVLAGIFLKQLIDMSAKGLNKILYVEDDVHMQRIARVVLEKLLGTEVRICCSGRVALAEVTEFKPDLVLSDLMLPEMDGLAILKALKEDAATAQIPLVFMTARARPDEIAEYRRQGALDVISKPFEPKTLAEKLQKLWYDTQQKNKGQS